VGDALDKRRAVLSCMCFARELILFCQCLEAGKGIVYNGARLSALSKTAVDLCRFRPIGQRKEVDSLQVQARAVNTVLNSLVTGTGITGTAKIP